MRSTPEWIGKTDDTPIPPRVQVRVFERYDGACQGCLRKLYPGDEWDCDHTIALINGGEHKESNLRPMCKECHRKKTAVDTREKSIAYRKRRKHIGVKLRKGKPLPGSRRSNIKITLHNGPVDRRTGEPLKRRGI